MLCCLWRMSYESERCHLKYQFHGFKPRFGVWFYFIMVMSKCVCVCMQICSKEHITVLDLVVVSHHVDVRVLSSGLLEEQEGVLPTDFLSSPLFLLLNFSQERCSMALNPRHNSKHKRKKKSPK